MDDYITTLKTCVTNHMTLCPNIVDTYAKDFKLTHAKCQTHPNPAVKFSSRYWLLIFIPKFEALIMFY